MNNEKFSLRFENKETIILLNLKENDKITLYKKEKNCLKEGDKICLIETGENKVQIVSPCFGQLTKIQNIEGKVSGLVITICEHEMEFNGMCADCGFDLRLD